MDTLSKISLVLVAGLIGLTAHAADMAKYMPRVDYSADQTMETSDVTMSGKVYSSTNKERREMNVSGENMIMIMRRDKQTAWTLIPSERMYMEVSTKEIKEQKDNLDNYKIETTVIGSETVNGVPCEKSKVIMTNKSDGSKMGGFWWVTKDGIVMKMDMISKDKDEKLRMKIELSNLKIGKQSPALFEIPAGYSKMAMPSMGSIQDMMRDSGDDSDRDEDQPKSKGGFNFNDAMKLIR